MGDLLNNSDIMIVMLLYLVLPLSALFLMYKKERSYMFFKWVLIIVFLPVFGPLLYYLKVFANK